MSKKILNLVLISLVIFPFTYAANYFGDGSDGDVIISSSTSLSSSRDGPMVVRNYNSLTINSGATLTTSNRCKGLLIYVREDLTVHGSISMTARGAKACCSNDIMLPMLKSGSSDTLSSANFNGAGSAAENAVANQPGISGDGKIYRITRTGGYGGKGCSANICYGRNGGTKSQGTGGGGGGGNYHADPSSSGDGGRGTCFGGGSGGGGARYNTGGDGSNCGGGGGDGSDDSKSESGGGAGNPGGYGPKGGANGQSGTGGVIWLIVGGDVTVTGNIQAKGRIGE